MQKYRWYFFFFNLTDRLNLKLNYITVKLKYRWQFFLIQKNQKNLIKHLTIWTIISIIKVTKNKEDIKNGSKIWDCRCIASIYDERGGTRRVHSCDVNRRCARRCRIHCTNARSRDSAMVIPLPNLFFCCLFKITEKK